MIRLEDVKQNNVSEAPQAEPAEETAAQDSQPEQQTPEVSDPKGQSAQQEAAERMVPVSVVQAERKKRQELQRRIAELEGNQKLNQYDPNDLETVINHPAYQELAIKQAKQELTDHARNILDSRPGISQAIKKAILSNVRGFVKETTTDIESAKLDVEEYIDSLAEETQDTTPPPKQFQVASTNVAKSDVQGVRPQEIAKILEKPIDSWTDEEVAKFEEYSQSKK